MRHSSFNVLDWSGVREARSKRLTIPPAARSLKLAGSSCTLQMAGVQGFSAQATPLRATCASMR